MPLLVNMLVSFSDKVATRDFQMYFEAHLEDKPFMVHNVVAATFNILNQYVKAARHSLVLKKLKGSNKISDDLFSLPIKMGNDFMKSLNIFTATGSFSHLFSKECLSYYIFFKPSVKR